jgi:NADH-ubiquinone oxidoreductase chain 1
VSYEVRLAVILIFYLRLSDRIILTQIIDLNIYWNKILLFLPIVIIWLVSCVAETNRTPFDFAEGESELVSGFNVEYGRLGFALIFMAEYARIFFLSLVFATLFMRSTYLGLGIYVWSILLVRVWIWARSTFPRYRYDKLINLAWKIYLPVVLISLYFARFIII